MKSLAELKQDYQADPRSWDPFSAAQHDALKAQLQPQARQGFSGDQRFWLERWWLACTAGDVAACNAALPPGTRVEPLEFQGALYLGSDLLTDADAEDSTYYPARKTLARLPRVRLDIELIRAAAMLRRNEA